MAIRIITAIFRNQQGKYAAQKFRNLLIEPYK